MNKAEQLRETPIQEKVPTSISAPELIEKLNLDQGAEKSIAEGEAALDSAKNLYGDNAVQEEMNEQDTAKNLDTVWKKIKESANKAKKSLLLAGVGLAGLGAVGATSPDSAKADTISPDSKQELKQDKFIAINAAKKLGFATEVNEAQAIIQKYLLEKTGKISGQLSPEEIETQLKELKATTLEMGGAEDLIGMQVIDNTIKGFSKKASEVKMEKSEVKKTKPETKVEAKSTPEAEEFVKKLMNLPDNPKAFVPGRTEIQAQAYNKTLQKRAAEVMIQQFVLQQTGKNSGRVEPNEMRTYLPVLNAALEKVGIDKDSNVPGIEVLKNMIKNYR